MDSIASAVSLPRVPTEWTPMASAAGNGPRPATGTKKTSSSTSSGTARIASRKMRMAALSGRGETLCAAKNPSGSDRTAPMSVPIQAIWIDSFIASRASPV